MKIKVNKIWRKKETKKRKRERRKTMFSFYIVLVMERAANNIVDIIWIVSAYLFELHFALLQHHFPWSFLRLQTTVTTYTCSKCFFGASQVEHHRIGITANITFSENTFPRGKHHLPIYFILRLPANLDQPSGIFPMRSRLIDILQDSPYESRKSQKTSPDSRNHALLGRRNEKGEPFFVLLTRRCHKDRDLVDERDQFSGL